MLDAACQAGGTSMFTNGVDPGWANDLLPLMLAGTCERIDTIRMMEVVNYATYDAASVLFDTMGFGKPLDETPLLLLPGILTHAWGPVVHVVAAGLGVELDGIEEWYERVPAERDIEVDAGTVAAGTAGALRFEVRGMVDGKARIVLEHVTRLADEQMPDWPQPIGSGCYRVVIEGNPSMTVDVAAHGEDGDHNTGNLVSTVGRVLNAIPHVQAADARSPLHVSISRSPPERAPCSGEHAHPTRLRRGSPTSASTPTTRSGTRRTASTRRTSATTSCSPATSISASASSRRGCSPPSGATSRLFGYGAKGFTLSLIETAIEVTDGSHPGAATSRPSSSFGKELLDHPVELLPGRARDHRRAPSRRPRPAC